MSNSAHASFPEHLQKQLGFLARSCALYDTGCKDEAVRIATVIRVLIHDTKKSTSLLRHLSEQGINLLSTCPDKDAEFADLSKYSACTFRGLGQMKLTPGRSVEFVACLGSASTQSVVSVQKWWKQIVWVLDPQTKLTRESIVLTAANQDGGAHVDATLKPEYEALGRDGAAGVFGGKSAGLEFQGVIQEAHLVSLRQMGYELLNSPELVGLGVSGDLAPPPAVP